MVGSKPSVFLFIGNEELLKEKEIDSLRSSLLGDSARELDYKVFRGGETNAREILDYASTAPFISERRFVVVKNFEKLPKEGRDSIVSYIEKPSKTAWLVLDVGDKSGVEEYSRLSRYASIRYFGNLSDSDIDSWIKGFLASNGKEVEDDALDMIRETEIRNLLLLRQELEKLIAFVGERKVITAADAEQLLSMGFTASAFDIIGAIERRQADAAMRIVSDLLLQGKRHYEIIGLLCWHLKRVWRAKALKSRGQSSSQIGRVLNISRKYLDDFFRQVDALDIAEVKSKMAVLLEADLNIKKTKYDPTLVLEFAITRLCLSR